METGLEGEDEVAVEQVEPGVSKVKGHLRKEKLDQYRKTRRQNTMVLVVGFRGQKRERK